MTKRVFKFFRSLIKFILPLIFKILIKLKSNRRVINYLNEQSYKSNDKYNFSKLISNLLKEEKIVALDVGAQGGFNSDQFFSLNYNSFFEDILVEPIKSEIDKMEKKKIKINKGLWSRNEKKNYTCLKTDWEARRCINLVKKILIFITLSIKNM